MPRRPKNQQKSTPPSKPSTIRIIGGQWRGRKLPVNNADGLRPTGDRMRETLFNWLMPYIHDAHIWDIFAGTGALGLEALSRGARSATFFELNTKNASLLRENITQLITTQTAKSLALDAIVWLQQNQLTEHQERIDIVFIDPPFEHKLWQETINVLDRHSQLSDNTIIYIESKKDTTFITPVSWQLLKHKHSGAVSSRLYQRTLKP